MFEHSVKVPRSYKLAGNIIRQVKEEGANLKSLLYHEKNKHFPVKAVHALIVETLKHEIQLSELLKKTGLLIKEPRFDPWLARILITELLWGKQSLTSESKPVKTIRGYHKEFLSLSESLKINVDQVVTKKVLKPRYIRINTLRLTAADAIRFFQDEGWNLVRCTAGPYDDFLKQVENLGPYDFIPDYHVKVVFVFAQNTQFYDCELYQNGDIILQDKATCLAGYLLAPTPGSTILDMCAAPGMKTTHLAAIIKNEGTIYSVEQDEERYKMLCDFVEKSGVSCVKALNRDVATVNKDDCPNVDYVLLDPSCSGSGIRRIEENDATFDLESGRVQKLSGFQAKLLRHALNEFRTAKRIVYSTCSIYPQENEEVVQDVIRNYKGKFRLVSAKEKFNNNWNNVGDLKYEGIGEKCIYTRPETDYTSGFFVAVFERFDDEDTYTENTLDKTDTTDHAVENPQIECDGSTSTHQILKDMEKSKKKKPLLLGAERSEEVVYQYTDSCNTNKLDSKNNNHKSKIIQKELETVSIVEIIEENQDLEENSIPKKKKEKYKSKKLDQSVSEEDLNKKSGSDETNAKIKKIKHKNKRKHSEMNESPKQFQVSEDTNEKIVNIKDKNKTEHFEADKRSKEIQTFENTHNKITQIKHTNKGKHSEMDESTTELKVSEETNDNTINIKHKRKKHSKVDETTKEIQEPETTNDNIKKKKHKNKRNHSETDENPKESQASGEADDIIKKINHKNKRKRETDESPKEFQATEETNNDIKKKKHKNIRKHSETDEGPKEFQESEETKGNINKKKHKNK